MARRARFWLLSLAVSVSVSLTLAAAGCGSPAPQDPPARRPTGPLDRAAYAERLAEAAGAPLSVDRFAAAAGAAAERIEQRMDELARGLGEPGGWRPLFARLRLEGPADEAAVLAAYRAELARAAAYTRDRQLVTEPPPPPDVVALENPSLRAYFPLALYHDGRFAVTTRSAGGDEPAYLANHCRVCIPPLAVHEGYPGHHVAFARMAGADGRPPAVAELARYKSFVEGWALYAETLMLELDYYQDAAQRLAAWRMVLLRLLRAEIDVRLNGGGLTPGEAEALYRERLLLGPAAAAAEVRAHLAKPTVKASYFLGLLQILELRRAFLAARPGSPLRDFHDRLLGPPAPIPRIARQRFDLALAPPAEAELAWPFGPRPAPGDPSAETVR